jgi:hypothetical protein
VLKLLTELKPRRITSVVISFLCGFGSTLDMFTPFASSLLEKSDAEKLQEDWDRIICDFWQAAGDFDMGKAGPPPAPATPLATSIEAVEK